MLQSNDDTSRNWLLICSHQQDICFGRMYQNVV